MIRTLLLSTETASFWGTIHAGAENIRAGWYGQKLEVSYTVNGARHHGYVVPSVSNSPEQMKNLLRILR